MRQQLALLASCIAVIGLAGASCGQSAALRSPDGRYEATLVGSGGNVHYQVKDVQSGKVLLTTHAQYPTANDVKAGAFSADSRTFCGAYHYGSPAAYTWIGRFEIATGKLVSDEKKSEWTKAISCG